MAKNNVIFLSFLFCASCFSKTAYMSYEDFSRVQTGTPASVVETEMGQPYAIHTKADGSKEYEYIERIDTGSGVVAENHYFLIVKEGKVVGKYMNREQPPAYDQIYHTEPNYPKEMNYPPTS